MHITGKLSNGCLIFYSRYSCSLNNLLCRCRIFLTVEHRIVLRYHNWKVRLAGNHRGIHIVKDKAKVPAQQLVTYLLICIHQIQFHLGIEAALVAVSLLRIVHLFGVLYVGENPAYIPVIRLNNNLIQNVGLSPKNKIYLIKNSRLDFLFCKIITHHLHPQNFHSQISGLQGVVAVHICRDSNGCARKVNAGKRESLICLRICYPSLNLCALSQKRRRDGQ